MSLTEKPLEGQVAVVTGAGTGIGRATAIALGRAGARVVVSGRRREPLEAVATELRAAGVATLVQPGDVTRPEAAAALADAASDAWGRLDLLVNNAGLNARVRDLDAVSVDDWREVIEVNLHGTFLPTSSALPVMRAAGRGTVVNVASIAGLTASLLSGPAYSASKAAVVSFTQSINLAERRHGIRACAICPGEVATPIMELRPHPPSAEAQATMLQPEDIAETILHVAALPDRAAVELVTIRPTVLRDLNRDRPEAR
jgi:NADP-dependent 3-hydroxy acid dehydrogenase YdfG